MDTNSLKIFVEVARLGSFAAAARKLELDPSSISRTVASLEQTLGLRLFQRTTRQLTLTEAGEIYLQRISPLLNEFDYALDEAHKVSRGPSGNLRITASVAFGQVCILPLIPEFRRLYPQINLELLLTDSVVDLIAGGVDLACRMGPTFDSQYIGTRLFATHYRVCVSPEYFATMPKVSCPEDLEQHHCLVFMLPEYRSQWTFRDTDSKLTQVQIKSNISITSALALREAALCGMGPVLLADWLIGEDIAQGRLIPLLPQYQVTAEDFNSAVWLLYPSRNFLPNKTRVMIDFLKQKYPDRLYTRTNHMSSRQD